MSDWFRWSVVFLCVFNVGTLGALFERVGKSFLPTLWMRLLIVSQVLNLTVIAFAVHGRIGHPMTFRTPMFATTLWLQVAALVGVHRWYGTPQGRAHSARMMKGR